MIKKAEKEIKEMSQNTLSQKSQIKKNFLKRSNENSIRIKSNFIETYNQVLNNALASTLLKIKQDVLAIKNKLLNELRLALLQQVKSIINNNYESYITFLINDLNKFAQTVKYTSKISLVLNKKDYAYFSENSRKIEDIFKTQITLKTTEVSFIGGFKAFLENEEISYDLTLENFIAKQSVLIESAFSERFFETFIDELNQKFEKFISNKKENIEEHLKEYDRIG